MARQNRRSLVLLGERMCWQCRRPPERPGEKTCWPSHIRRRLETDTYLGTGVGHLFESVDEAYESATKRISTAMLRRIMDMAQADHQPPLVRGRRVKLKYAHAGGYNPPRIVIHGNQVHDLPDSYKRYLMNYYRKALKIMGTPIKIEFREGDNPFAGRTNKVTLSQKRKIRAFSKENRNKS